MANRTVDDFEFDPKFGFSASAGKQPVRGYMRGGKVEAGCKCGGEVHELKKGGAAKKKSPKRPRISKKEEQMAVQLINQMANQAAVTGRMPGTPSARPRGVPVASREPMIPMKNGGRTK